MAETKPQAWAKDFVDIKLRWDDEGPEDGTEYRIFTRSGNGSRIDEGSTQYMELTLEHKEFWTNYEIIVERSDASNVSATTELYTGPGGEFF